MDFLSGFLTPEGFETVRFIAHIALRPELWPRVAALERHSKLASAALQSAVEECNSDWRAFAAKHSSARAATAGDAPANGGSSASTPDEKERVVERMTVTPNMRPVSPGPDSIPSQMLAAVYYGQNDMRLETVPVPRIGPGELLVRIHTCGICGTDLKKISTGSHSAPRIFGHEMAGVVVARGAGVTRFAEGDRVMAFHHIPCGNCYYCERKVFSQCPVYKRVGTTAGFGEPSGGGFSEYIRVMDWIVERGVIAIPDAVSFEQASHIEPVNTVWKGIETLARGSGRNRPGDWPGANRTDAGETGPTCGSQCNYFRFVPAAAYNWRAVRINPVDRRLPGGRGAGNSGENRGPRRRRGDSCRGRQFADPAGD